MSDHYSTSIPNRPFSQVNSSYKQDTTEEIEIPNIPFVNNLQQTENNLISEAKQTELHQDKSTAEIQISFAPLDNLDSKNTVSIQHTHDPISEELAWQLTNSRSGEVLFNHLKVLEKSGTKLTPETILNIFTDVVQQSKVLEQNFDVAGLTLTNNLSANGTGRVELNHKPIQGLSDKALLTLQFASSNRVNTIYRDQAGRIFVDIIHLL